MEKPSASGELDIESARESVHIDGSDQLLRLKERSLQLVRLHNSPFEIAFGVAIGVFIGVLPIYGFQTLLAVLLAMIVPRTNKIAIIAGTGTSIPFTIPFITWAGYNIGRLILGAGYPEVGWDAIRSVTLSDIPGLYGALFAGSIVLGVICAAGIFFPVWLVVRRVRNRRMNGGGGQHDHTRVPAE